MQMGLAVEVGLLADFVAEEEEEEAESLRESFDLINEVLRDLGIPLHREPNGLPSWRSRAIFQSYPYAYLHHLRRVYAYSICDPSWIPVGVASEVESSEDPVLEAETDKMVSHLLCHSDSEGFYLPIDFDEILFDDKDRIPGVILGSSFRLRDELIEIAGKLGIILNDDVLSDSEADKINSSISRQDALCNEKMVWLSLFEAARLSIEHTTAICFV
jgi:hypothetical protein